MSDERNEREQARVDRRSERDARRSEREGRRERGFGHAGFAPELATHIHEAVREGLGAAGGFPFSDLAGGEEHAESVERTFIVDGAPSIRLRNVSGESRIAVGPEGEVRLRARKRVRGASEERAKRLLENVEIRMEQNGTEISIRPHLYEQDRGWLDLFRGGRVAVDFDLTVPQGSRIDATTVSGGLDVRGTRGPLDVQSVSGDVTLADIHGPMRLKTVSGDASCADLAGALEANSVSGDLDFARCRLHSADVVTVSGDVDVSGELGADRDHRFKTISGDIDLALVGTSYDIRFKTMSGELACGLVATVSGDGRRDKHIVAGDGGVRVTVKTVSGDLQLHSSTGAVPAGSPASAVPGAEAAPDPEATVRMDPPGQPDRDARSILERVARGELDVDAAAQALDAARGARG